VRRPPLLAIYETLKVSRISVSLNIDCGNGISDSREIVRRQFHVCAAKILFETVQLGGSGNRYDPRLLREQPRQRNLCFGRLLLVCNPAELIHQGLIGLSGICRETRNDHRW